MKKTLNHIFTFLLLLFISSCSEKEILSVATIPAEGDFLVTPSASSIVLTEEGSVTHTAIIFYWDTIVYGISTPVTFTLQMDSLNGDFSTPIEDVISTNTYQVAFTDSVMNIKTQKLNLEPNVEGQIKVRLKANLAFNNLPVYTQVVIISITPFEKEVPPLITPPANLYIVGDATALGWNPPNATQKFTKIDANTFTITIPLIGGKKYDFITTETNWSDPAYKAATNSEPPMGGNFVDSGANTIPPWRGSDIIAPAASGTYKITVNFKSGTYVLTQ